MCGIIGAVAQRNVVEILLEGLRRLEYRGYDSAGIAVLDKNMHLQCLRRVGKVNNLTDAVNANPLFGSTGIAHTRWATHGTATERNAHPHISGNIVAVHNGIIENYKLLREQLRSCGYTFISETDTEVIAHLIHWEQSHTNGILVAVMQRVVSSLRGTYGAVIMDARNPNVLVAARSGSSLVIGLGVGENFLASDQLALLPITRRFIYLEDGDISEITCHTVQIWNKNHQIVHRPIIESDIKYNYGNKGIFRHYMEKEIFEQPEAITNALEGRVKKGRVILTELNEDKNAIWKQLKHIQIIACGSSYHSAMVARYWFESLAGIPCDVEIASEFRYRKIVVRQGSLLINLSQSGETADTLAALRLTKTLDYLGSLAICNVTDSSLVRESDIALMTRAGPEIGVASTKAFTTQLIVLLMLVLRIGRLRGMSKWLESDIVNALQTLPTHIKHILSLSKSIQIIAESFFDKENAFFLGRGELYPIAMEGALKLKEISYIHAEAYAAGELKHGPLALIDVNMPVIVIAPNNKLLKKVKSNIEEISARGALLYIFSDQNAGFSPKRNMKVISFPTIAQSVAPIFYSIPMQLLAYYIALIKGTDIDHPRNLAKSVTVE
ncbi:glucosamine--fructose-6-phosphate aminotransferase, isomerizing [secondary endosymbiont of Heteropsylla cubana]|uniref:Glutamine--fructose-6-phosphate aminotransferase [isomerizing] n=1 Tax=secondary endosymbiont of Heteropsylla cubana TaxID=134287 RepID=J3TYA8_9ENTR|nr:glutamine--fructose-6-phosphate transaminase (isomerizing) [secondary endosymbiont of Heteropsylla cubana]AFP85340.1 glucosamine--fructose-6-phosphate aminotransferase, isomerizing [secondary endosymbiont of Heteropsylla cubana]